MKYPGVYKITMLFMDQYESKNQTPPTLIHKTTSGLFAAAFLSLFIYVVFGLGGFTIYWIVKHWLHL